MTKQIKINEENKFHLLLFKNNIFKTKKYV